MADLHLLHGDCLDILPNLNAQVSLVLADLPFGTTRCQWDNGIPLAPLWNQYKRLLKPNGVALLFSIMPFTAALWQSNPDWWRYEWVWRKNGVTRFLDAKRRPLLDYENIQVFYERQPTYNPQKVPGKKAHSRGTKNLGKSENHSTIYRKHIVTPTDESGMQYPRNVIEFAKVPPSKILHPTQKPVELLEYFIRTYTNPGELVLDNTMGVGSTGVAAQNQGRAFIGIEKQEDYFEIARQRIGEPIPVADCSLLKETVSQ